MACVWLHRFTYSPNPIAAASRFTIAAIVVDQYGDSVCVASMNPSRKNLRWLPAVSRDYIGSLLKEIQANQGDALYARDFVRAHRTSSTSFVIEPRDGTMYVTVQEAVEAAEELFNQTLTRLAEGAPSS